jgi:hypothetical protein
MPSRLQLLGLAFLAATAATLHTAQATEAKEGFNPVAAKAVMAAIDQDQRLAGMLRQCPADLFGREARISRVPVRSERLADGSCDARLGQCFEACARDRGGNACLCLARSFQDHEEAVAPRYWGTLFAAACAAGKGAGCTNRAAAMEEQSADAFTTLAASAGTRHRP